jgi:hypothetical protein
LRDPKLIADFTHAIGAFGFGHCQIYLTYWEMSSTLDNRMYYCIMNFIVRSPTFFKTSSCNWNARIAMP